MGNFSRDPEARLADASTKHYVGLRVNQGVPLLDADLHLLDGLHRGELEGIGQWMIGNGVPVGSDAFRPVALANGGQNTLVLRAKTVGVAASSLHVDIAGSTAAAALGFSLGNADTARWGDSPALLTSSKAQPFVLSAGQTLVMGADGGALETIIFVPGDFANIAAATAAEVAAKISATATRVAASAGAGSDVFLSGGDGTTAGAGRILVDGRMALIERGLRFTEQPLYQNSALAAAWGVAPVAAIPTPTINEAQTLFLDVWHREVDRKEDGAIVDSRIGIETAVSLRREWAARAVPSAQFAAALALKPVGHVYYPLAALNRGANDPKITTAMIVDLRDTDASVRPEIAYRADSGAIIVDTARFKDMLTVTRDGARDFITYLTTKFVTPSSNYLAAEIAGIEALSAIANTADHALGAIFARTLGTRGALGVMRQLYDAEKRFVSTWLAVVLPLVKGGQSVYQNAFASTVLTIKGCLDGPAPGGLIPVTTALGASNLDGAVASQERIASELSGQAGKPLGIISLKYLGSVALTVQPNTPLDLRYEVTGDITPDDDLQVQVFLDPAWTVTLKNGDGSTPFALHGGPGAFTRQFLVSITPPAVPAAQTNFSTRIQAKKNPGGVFFVTTQKSLQIGGAPPPSEDQYVITVSASVVDVAGIYQVNHGTVANLTFNITNNTGALITVDLDPSPAAAGWTVLDGGFAMPNHPIAPLATASFLWHFQAPAAVGPQLTFTLRARDHLNPATVFAEVMVTLESK